jgi:hypothetical protein
VGRGGDLRPYRWFVAQRDLARSAGGAIWFQRLRPTLFLLPTTEALGAGARAGDDFANCQTGRHRLQESFTENAGIVSWIDRTVPDSCNPRWNR